MATAGWCLPWREITLLVIIGGFLLAETAQPGDSRFLIVGKKVGIKASCG
jgi:hypothetical protein